MKSLMEGKEWVTNHMIQPHPPYSVILETDPGVILQRIAIKVTIVYDVYCMYVYMMIV